MPLVAIGSAPVTSTPAYDSIWTTVNLISHALSIYGPQVIVQAKPVRWHITRRRGSNDINCGRYRLQFAPDIIVGSIGSVVRSTTVYKPNTLPTVTDTGSSIFWDSGILDGVAINLSNQTNSRGDDSCTEMAIPIAWAAALPPAWSMRDSLDVAFTDHQGGYGISMGTLSPTLANLIPASQWHPGHVPAFIAMEALPDIVSPPGGPIGQRVIPFSRPSSPLAYSPMLYRHSDATSWVYANGRGGFGAFPSHYKQSIRIMAHGSVASTDPAPSVSVIINYTSLSAYSSSLSISLSSSIASTKYGTSLWVMDQTIDPYAYIPSGTIFRYISPNSASGLISSIVFDSFEPGWPSGFTRDGIPGTIVHPGRIIQVTA